tara:strand:- start:336 stop:491 length:156 start_codon:yes stop_codon:yes gene_type:complete
MFDTMIQEPFQQWGWHLKRFVSYHETHPAFFHHQLAELEKKIDERFLGLVT